MRVPGELLQMCAQKGLSVEGTVWGLNDNEKPRGRVPGGDCKDLASSGLACSKAARQPLWLDGGGLGG